MLVLTRRVGEEIVINGDVRVAVIAAQGGRVRLGIVAPRCVRVDRGEVHDRRKELTAQSSGPPSESPGPVRC